MRRSRIKVMPSVPARRKTGKDARNEKDETPYTMEGAESQEIFVPRVKEEKKDNIIQGYEFETDTARVSGVSSVLERVEACEGERAAEQCESQAVRASSEEREDAATRQQPAQQTAEHKGSGTPDYGSTYSPNRAATRRSNRRIVKQPPNVTTAAGTTPAKNVASAKSRREQKINVSESMRKLDRARREFRRKYKQKPPDRTKLTMYDLIHYNPVTNPMKKTNNADTPTSAAPSPTRLVVKDEDEKENECDAGEVMPLPQVEFEPDECDAEEMMPVPQLKVEPDECDAEEVTPVPQLKVEPDECDAGVVMAVPQLKVEPDECDAGVVMAVPQLKVKPDEYDAGELTLVLKLKVKADECEAVEVMPLAQLKVKTDECEAVEVMPVGQLKVKTDEREAVEVLPAAQSMVEAHDPLVFDDRSLVVDHTEAQKSHDFEYDDSNGNGFSKRGQPYRNWTKQDTLKFYKALNTIGTDFYLMQSLFPERTRKEIMMKYKKEDKLNRHKIEKALVHHQEFNIESLQQDLVVKKSQRR